MLMNLSGYIFGFNETWEEVGLLWSGVIPDRLASYAALITGLRTSNTWRAAFSWENNDRIPIFHLLESLRWHG